MIHSDNNLEKQLNQMPKPFLSDTAKQTICQNMMNEWDQQNESKTFTIKVSYGLASIAAAALLFFFIFTSSGVEQIQKQPISFLSGAPDIEELRKYEETFVGDNSSVSAILYQLPGHNYQQKFSLQTREKPYGMKVSYGPEELGNDEGNSYNKYWSDSNAKKIFAYNATALFALISNVDTIQFVLEGEPYVRFSREELDGFFGREISEYAGNNRLWNSEVIKTLKDEKRVDDLYDKK
ncbi:DUF4825 domain-containing protein [Metabacillus dongyingensis]|uniref:DUF4825 domain-containing protein n=1 Tax=Metabacillus dongyingensis TaxID=2874282 RepID=UPI003B8CD59F